MSKPAYYFIPLNKLLINLLTEHAPYLNYYINKQYLYIGVYSYGILVDYKEKIINDSHFIINTENFISFINEYMLQYSINNNILDCDDFYKILTNVCAYTTLEYYHA